MALRFWILSNIDTTIVIICALALILSLIVVLAAYLWARRTQAPVAQQPNHPRPYGPKECMGDAQWDFSKSWASTLTVVGALLGTLLSSLQGTLPQYTILNLFFLLLVVLAPLIYSINGKLKPVPPSQDPYELRMQADIASIARQVSTITQKLSTEGQQLHNLAAQGQLDIPALLQALVEPNEAAQPNQNSDQTTYQYQGYVGGFLAACVLTLWAVVGELITLMFLLGDLKDLKPFNSSLLIAQIFLFLAVLLVLSYGWKTVPWTLEAQVSKKAKESRKQTVRHYRLYALGETEAAINQTPGRVSAALPSWSLL